MRTKLKKKKNCVKTAAMTTKERHKKTVNCPIIHLAWSGVEQQNRYFISIIYFPAANGSTHNT